MELLRARKHLEAWKQGLTDPSACFLRNMTEILGVLSEDATCTKLRTYRARNHDTGSGMESYYDKHAWQKMKLDCLNSFSFQI